MPVATLPAEELRAAVESHDWRNVLKLAAREYADKYLSELPRSISVVIDLGEGQPPEVLIVSPPAASPSTRPVSS